MTADRVIRFVTALAVLAVAVIAATVSYSHIEYLALAKGQTITASRLLPASVDGVVLVSSMVLLDAARRAVPVPGLARVMLAAGVLATLGANSAVGASHGVVGVLVTGWPAVAFIGCAETFLAMIRGRSQAVPEALPTATLAVPERGPVTGPSTPSVLPGRRSPARTPNRVPEQIFRAELKAGTVPGIRTIKTRCKVGQDTAKAIQAHLAAVLSERHKTLEVVS